MEGFESIKKNLELPSDEDEREGNLKAVAQAVKVHKSGKSVKEMILGVYEDNFWIARDPMTHYLYERTVFCSDEEIARIESELLPPEILQEA